MNRESLPAYQAREEIDAEFDIRDQKEPFPAPERLGAPEGAPNVLLILLDDMGFGASTAFGGPCFMPTAEALSEGGLRYSRFHTTAICAPTRAALLTGRNHHSVGMGILTEMANDSPGYDGMRPASAGTLAQTLKYNGYATGAFGKWHQTPYWEQSEAGPFDRWPTNEGFDRFYGILDGKCDQFSPSLVDGLKQIDPPATEEEGYHFSEDIVDQARDWIRRVRTYDAGKPWFTYLAFGATHCPHQVPKEWRNRNRGDFARGWDRQREITLERQKELGLVPQDAELAPWMPGVSHWDELDETGREVAERLMENYASFAEHTDVQVGRLVDFLREQGELENTIVIYILGDNGAEAVGEPTGTLNDLSLTNGFKQSAEEIAARLQELGIEELGGPHTSPNYPAGWAVAMNTPYQWAKSVASHYGGTRNGTIVHWPKGIKARGEIRHQWHHVIDVAPTVLEAIGLPHPERINGIKQDPLEGTSFLYSLNDTDAPDRHTTQYFEMLGNRGIYHEGWTATVAHRNPARRHTAMEETSSYADDVWELYDTGSDWTQARDLAAEHPQKLAELKELFLAEARKYKVLPLDDRPRGERFNDSHSGLRQLGSHKSATLTPRDSRINEWLVPNLKNTSHEVVVDVEVQSQGSDGVLVAQGGRFGGWSLYVKAGYPIYAYNAAGTLTYVTSDRPLGPGRHRIQYSFDYDGGGLGKGGTGRLLLDGEEVGSARIERTVGFLYSTNERLNVGIDRGTPVTEEYSRGAGNPFVGGEIHTVTLAAADDTVHPNDIERLTAALSTH